MSFRRKRAAVTAGVDGVVARVLKLEGDAVKAGDVIAMLEDESYTAAAAAARVGVRHRRSRPRPRPRASGTRRPRSRPSRGSKSYAARIALEEERLASTRLVAPVAGVIVTPRIQERVGQNLAHGGRALRRGGRRERDR